MSHTDPIADMLTRIRNAIMAEKKDVAMPLSKMKLEIAKILKREGYLNDFKVEKTVFPPTISVGLKYNKPKDNAIEGIKRVSKPGRRVYAGSDEIPKVLGGLGVTVLSTNKGLMTGKECEKNNVGGEVLLYVW
ncbi:MAG: 30S ribosomal protein S8 [bacterium]|nr:30S ribosomal protein S8 [bacterium]